MKLHFSKMHGVGNDFIVIDGVRQRVTLDSDRVRRLADRHFGVGCDQLLLIEAAEGPGIDFHYRIFNADGSEVGQCGNGARCFARFVHDKGLTDKDRITVATRSGLLTLQIHADGQVSVAMGVPRWEPAAVPFVAPRQAMRYTLDVEGHAWTIGVVSMGNPHAVLRVDDIRQAPVATLGPRIQRHPCFPESANVGFMQVLGPDALQLRVFERGVGETLACGSGACAAVVVGQRWGLLAPTVRVQLPGGELTVNWSGEEEQVIMTGPATRVFEGEIEL